MFKRRISLFFLCIGLLGLPPLQAQQPKEPSRGGPPADKVTAKQVRGNLYQAAGGVGNAFFYVGPEEVLVIDAKMTADAARQMLAEIKRITDKPVRRVILTHSDGDHVGGLAGFPPGLTIISHANARQDIMQANATAAAKLPLPNETFSKDLTLYVRAVVGGFVVGGHTRDPDLVPVTDDTDVRLLHFGPAHTNGDIVVYIPLEKVAIVGDLIFIGRDPLIHAAKHGSSFGLVSVLKALLELDADVFLSGHADGVDKKAIETLIAQIEQKQAKVKALIQEGKTLAEVKQAMAVGDPPVGASGRRFSSLVEIIYQELTAKK